MSETIADIVESWQDDERGEVRIGWAIPDLATADWALRRLGECEGEIEEIERQYEAALAMLAARRDALKAKATKGVVFFRAALTEYADRSRSELLHGKRKSREFLHGKIAFRSTAERLEVTDKDTLLAWLSQQDVSEGLWRYELRPELKALQDRFKATGEVPPGMDVKPATETITVEAIAPELALTKGEKP